MKLKSFFLTMIILVGLCINAFAQIKYISHEKAQELSKRIILVELFNEISNDDKQANENIRNYFLPNLKVGKEKKCVSAEEISSLMKANKEKYAVINHSFDNYTLQSVSRNRETGTGKTATANTKGLTYKESHSIGDLPHFDIVLSMDSKNKDLNGFITEVDFVHYKLRPEDYIFASLEFNRLYEASMKSVSPKDYYNPEKAIESLKSKTLLIDKDKTDFSADEAKGYDAEYRFVDYNTIKEAILTKEAGKVYPLLMWSDQLNAAAWVLVDTETGEIYSQITNGGVNVVAWGEYEPSLKLNKSIFKYFDSVTGNKFNNRYK